jgi:hypothetical protein
MRLKTIVFALAVAITGCSGVDQPRIEKTEKNSSAVVSGVQGLTYFLPGTSGVGTGLCLAYQDGNQLITVAQCTDSHAQILLHNLATGDDTQFTPHQSIEFVNAPGQCVGYDDRHSTLILRSCALTNLVLFTYSYGVLYAERIGQCFSPSPAIDIAVVNHPTFLAATCADVGLTPGAWVPVGNFDIEIESITNQGSYLATSPTNVGLSIQAPQSTFVPGLTTGPGPQEAVIGHFDMLFNGDVILSYPYVTGGSVVTLGGPTPFFQPFTGAPSQSLRVLRTGVFNAAGHIIFDTLLVSRVSECLRPAFGLVSDDINCGNMLIDYVQIWARNALLEPVIVGNPGCTGSACNGH